MRLYEIAAEWERLADIAFSNVDDDGEMPQDIVAEMNAVEASFDAKLSACCRVVRNLEAAADACDTEAKRLKARKDVYNNNADRLKSYMKDVLERLGERKREIDGIFTVSINNNPPSVAVLDLDLVPSEFDKVFERAVELSRIKEALKAGVVVPGVELRNGTHLRIR